MGSKITQQRCQLSRLIRIFYAYFSSVNSDRARLPRIKVAYLFICNTVYLFSLTIKTLPSPNARRRQTCPALWQDFPSQASGCPATPQAAARSGDAWDLTARRPFKSAARPADQRGPSTFVFPSSRASFRCLSSGALCLRDGKAVSHLLGFRIYAAPLPLPSAWDTPDTGDPVPCRWASSLRAVICHRLLPSVLPLKPSGCVNGNRETQRECFQALRVHGWQSQALCRPFKTIHGEFPHPGHRSTRPPPPLKNRQTPAFPPEPRHGPVRFNLTPRQRQGAPTARQRRLVPLIVMTVSYIGDAMPTE